MTKDIVCGMYVDEAKTPFTAARRGTTYYFCSENCRFRRLKFMTVLALTFGSLTLSSRTSSRHSSVRTGGTRSWQACHYMCLALPDG